MTDATPATPEDREKIVKALKSGNFKIANEDAFNRINTKKPDFTVTEVTARGGRLRDGNPENSFIEFDWGTKSAGFGSTTFYIENGKVTCDNEGMDRDFIMSVFKKFLDDVSLNLKR